MKTSPTWEWEDHPDAESSQSSKKINTPRQIIIRPLKIENYEKIVKMQNRKDKSHIKANPLK
jgi:hypothetical protein